MRLEIGSPSTVTIVPCSSEQPQDIFAESKTALSEGIRSAQAGDRLRARASLLRAAELDPKSESAWLWLASISEIPEELLAYLKNVLAINPENERAQQWMSATRSLLSKTSVERGRVAEADGQAAYARECYANALDHDDRNTEARLHLGMLAESEEEKIAILEIVLRDDPSNTVARDAIEDARKSIIDRRLSAAKASAVGGNKETALREVDAILAAVPHCTEAWMLWSHIVDSFADKLECFDRILSYDPNNSLVAAGREALAAIVYVAQPAPASAESANEPEHFSGVIEVEPELDSSSFEILEESSDLGWTGEVPGLERIYVNTRSDSEDIVLPTTETQEMRIEFGSDKAAEDAIVIEAESEAHDARYDREVATHETGLVRTKRILVVDDSPTIRKLISGKLEKSGHDVICAEDGVEAVGTVESMVPDLVLLDITMPRMDGYEVCKSIRGREATKNVPVIMISGKDGFFDKVRGRMAGASGYITKPFGPETLMKTVEACLNGEMPDFE